MTFIHIFTAAHQPATKYTIDLDPPMVIECSPYARRWAMCCRRFRLARNLTVQAYYDGNNYHCLKGCGCKKVKR